MNEIALATIEDVRAAERVLRRFLSPTPLIRSYALEKELGLSKKQQVWLKDYGWTPSGSFKVMGALNWVHTNQTIIGDRPVATHSSGNFASGLSFACQQFAKRAIIVMPDNAPRIKFELTRSFGAEIQTYDIARDHETNERTQRVEQLSKTEGAILASPYDDNAVIAGNGVGGLEIVAELHQLRQNLSHFLCPVSGGGLMAGHALAIADAFPNATMIAVEPKGASDYGQSLKTGVRTTISKPESICDGLLSYDVGVHNWPILKKLVPRCIEIPDSQTKTAMRWIFQKHGLKTEPSGAIAIAALLSGNMELKAEGAIVAVISGRNMDDDRFALYMNE